jgi:serine/threonine protein phosphatase PrpC
MPMLGGGATHVGKVRPHNEDGLLVEPDFGFFVVADGMGGHKAGEVASALALEAIKSFLVRATQDDDHTWPFGLERALDRNGNRIRTAVKLANRRVFRESERRDEYSGMGTTVAAVLVEGDSAVVCGVGDSRVYLIREGEIQRLTHDDTWVETLLAQTPGLDPAALVNHPMRHVLTRVVGAQDDVDVTVTTHLIAPGDRLVLCTDGVHGGLSDARIADIVRASGSVAEAADSLIKAAVIADGKDNVTAVVVEMAS